MSVRTRFAPSPTGFLHIGNIRTALFNFLYARHTGGQFILRIEDTDVERSRKEYADSILRDLERLGILWDEGPFYQSGRLSIYEEYFKKLKEKGKVYFCYCTPEELEARRREALLMKKPPRYDNRCRLLSEEEKKKREAQGVRPTVRFKVDETEPILVKDLIRGDVFFHPQEIGDFVILRSHPSKPSEFLPTFHFSVCVDDGLMKVTHVVRGEDHLSNSPRHVLLFDALGFPVPQFAHLSLIHGPGGEPLSKRLTSISVRDFVERSGYLPEALLNYLALLGWSPKDNREVMGMDELIREFDVANSTKHPAIFNEEKLEWINSEHLRKLPEREYFRLAAEFLGSLGDQTKPLFSDRILLEKSLVLVRTDVKKFQELPERLQFLPEPVLGELHDEEKAVLCQSQARRIFEEASLFLEKPEKAGEELFDALTEYLKKATGQKGKPLFMPLRVAITGSIHGPELKKIFGILDASSIRTRVQNAIGFCPK